MYNMDLLFSNVRRFLNVVCFFLGYSPASEFYMPTFWNRQCSETSAHKIQMPGNNPEESIQQGFIMFGSVNISHGII